MKVRITAIRKVKTLQDALPEFSLHLAAPPPAFAADVVVARQMYFAALKVENRVSRFLIIYSALAVFSTFKLGTRVVRRIELTRSSRLRIRPSR